MANLETSYLGLTIRNPIVVASSSLTEEVNQLVDCEKAGAGAVVLKCIYEENIKTDTHGGEDHEFYGIDHPEAYEYFYSDVATRYGTIPYCEKVKKARESVSIPVIASINCYSPSVWVDFAKDLENAGASALELNIAYPPVTKIMDDPSTHLNDLAETVETLLKKVSIPVSIKLPPAELFVGSMVKKFADTGVQGLILFSRFMGPKVNLETMEVESNVLYSSSSDATIARRFIALLANRVKCELIGAGGIHTAEGVLSVLCVGATSVQMASLFCRNGLSEIRTISDGIAAWMDKKGYAAIEDFRGCLATDAGKRQNPFGRFQYIRMLGHE